MFTIKLSLYDEEDIPFVWDTPGHIEINSNGTLVEGGGVWLWFYISGLMGRLQELIENPRETCDAHFSDMYSPFIFTLAKRKKKPNTISLIYERKVIGIHETKEVVLAFWNEVNRFMGIYESLIDDTHHQRTELNQSVGDFNKFVKKYLESQSDL